MPTSLMTRKYWVNIANNWAVNALGHPDYDNRSPQLDEFEAVMDELIADSEELSRIREKLSSGNFQLIAKDALDELHRAKHDMDELAEVFRKWDSVDIMLKGPEHAV